MDKTPNDTSHTLISGPIDTLAEMKTILTILQRDKVLRRQVTDEDINRFLHTLKRLRLNYIEGPVDTPREIALFFGILKNENIVSGPIDTPAEIKLFMEKLQQLGVLQTSFVDMKPMPAPKEELPQRKSKKRRNNDDDEDYRRHP